MWEPTFIVAGHGAWARGIAGQAKAVGGAGVGDETAEEPLGLGRAAGEGGEQVALRQPRRRERGQPDGEVVHRPDRRVTLSPVSPAMMERASSSASRRALVMPWAVMESMTTPASPASAQPGTRPGAPTGRAGPRWRAMACPR